MGPLWCQGRGPRARRGSVRPGDTMWIAGFPVAEIDRTALDAQTGGDANLAREVLALFADESRRLLAEMADPSLSDLRRAEIAHTLRGSAAGVGAMRVHALAGAAEDRLRAGEAGAREAVAALAEAVADAAAEIDAGP